MKSLYMKVFWFLFFLYNFSIPHGQTAEEPQYAALSIDGGGVKSFISMLILQKLDSCITEQKSSTQKIELRDLFDIHVGTSMGGLITIMITHPKYGEAGFTLDDWFNKFKAAKDEIVPRGYFNYINAVCKFYETTIASNCKGF